MRLLLHPVGDQLEGEVVAPCRRVVAGQIEVGLEARAAAVAVVAEAGIALRVGEQVADERPVEIPGHGSKYVADAVRDRLGERALRPARLLERERPDEEEPSADDEASSLPSVD